MKTTRRDFVKRSLLAGAAAGLVNDTVGTPLRGVRSVLPAAGADSGPGRLGEASLPYPLVPYGKGQPIYLADMERCEPSSALAPKWEPRHWKVIPFEAGEVKGSMVVAGQNTGVPDLEYALSQRGWHAIFFGIYSNSWESQLRVRFKADPVFSVLTPNNMDEEHLTWDQIQNSKHNYKAPGIEELFWRYADLSDIQSSLIFGQLKTALIPGDIDAVGNGFSPCWIAYIKLVPLTPAEVGALEQDRKRRDTRRLYAADDAFTPSAHWRLRTANDIRRQIEPYRDTDFSRLYWEAGMGDLAYYPSKVARLVNFEWMKDYYRTADRLVAGAYSDFQRQGIDPFRVALDYSHQIGLEFHASYRVAGFKFPPPEDEWNAGGLYDRHPEWRSLDRNGRSTPRLSYAFPEVRDFVYSIQEEVVRRYPVDGVSILYNRRLPVLGYEAPLRDTFKEKYGVDPCTLPENDSRWLAHSAEVLTGFMRELRRRMLAEAARQKRGPIGITALVMGSREENYSYGLDVETWVREGLIDTLVPYVSIRGGDSHADSWDDPRQAEFFINLTRGTPCRLALDLLPREIAPEVYKRRVDALYRAGVENIFFWDCYQRTNFDPSWTTVTRLGHKEELADWTSRGQPRVERPRRTVTRIADWDLSYGTPG